MSQAGAVADARPGLSFVRLLRLDVRHAYFKGSVARALRFVPLEDTRDFLNAFAIRVKEDGRGLSLYAEGGRVAALAGDCGSKPRCLDFAVLSSDPLSQVYTAPAPTLPVFGPAVSAEGELLAPDPSASRLEDPPPIPKADGISMPLALARLSLPAFDGNLEAWRSALGNLGVQRFLKLEARGTLWKYLLLGDWSAHAPRVVDLAGQSVFDDPQPVVLENGSPALAIRSRQDIPLREYSPLRLQLKDAAVRPERVLIKRLPVAAPERFHRDSVDGKPVLVSEIFIHH